MSSSTLEQRVIDWLTSEGLHVGGAPLARGTSLLDFVRKEIASVQRGRTVDVVFDGPPSHESGRFVEVEQDGKSINLGEWVKRPDGMWALRIENVG